MIFINRVALMILLSPIILFAQVNYKTLNTPETSNRMLGQTYSFNYFAKPLFERDDAVMTFKNFENVRMSGLLFPNRAGNINRQIFTNEMNASTEQYSEPSILVELGYIVAMEIVFAGMGYLASRDNRVGAVIVGGFDVFMGVAGVQNAIVQESAIGSVGYYLLSAGFIAKSLYNFEYGKKDSAKARFLTNFVGFNLLVFSGYYLDSFQ